MYGWVWVPVDGTEQVWFIDGFSIILLSSVGLKYVVPWGFNNIDPYTSPAHSIQGVPRMVFVRFEVRFSNQGVSKDV